MKIVKFTKVAICLIVILECLGTCKAKAEIGLKEAFKGKFLIGVALNNNQTTGRDTIANKLILKNFNSIVAENCMKSEVVQPIEGQFDFSQADQFVNFGEQHGMFIIGHTLIWHSQAPGWFFKDEKGRQVSREVLIDRMHKHINTVVSRYKGRVKAWDVVNEAINDDGSYRESPFFKIIGKDFIKLAFQFAHEADPNAQMNYNDYNMALPGKREAVVKMVKDLKDQGIRIDAVGMQGHLGLDFPTVDEFEKSIVAFSEANVKIMITELDLSILPSPWSKMGANVADNAEYKDKTNPYVNGVPADKNAVWENVYNNFFKLFIKHSDKIIRVTLWGLTDKDSWKNNWPIRGRKDYPLLFDRGYKPKPIVTKIIKEAMK
jgi:Beta-1,4-xylanase